MKKEPVGTAETKVMLRYLREFTMLFNEYELRLAQSNMPSGSLYLGLVTHALEKLRCHRSIFDYVAV